MYTLETLGGKKIILALVLAALVLVVALAGYFWWNKAKPENSGTAENITDQATKGALPSVSNNPLDGKPNLNPAERSNPITEVKTNPFE